jgi:biotin transport system substrate-specific component
MGMNVSDELVFNHNPRYLPFSPGGKGLDDKSAQGAENSAKLPKPICDTTTKGYPMSVNTLPETAADVAALRKERTRIVVSVLIFAALTALAARFSFRLPFTPVPITLQVLAVLLAGLVLGVRGGTASQLTYLAMIAVGVPFTASGFAGPAAFFSPTAGYLLAFVPAVFVVGALAVLAGLAVIYVGGASWLAVWLGGNWAKAWTLGVAPFIAADLAKAVLAVAATGIVRRVLGDGVR